MSQLRVKQGVKAQVKRATLRITGNRRANRVTLRLRRRRAGILEVDVRSNGSADFRFRRRSFRRIVLRGGAGNDTLAISERRGSFFRAERTTLDGGRGRDRLVFTGSGGADSLALSASRRRLRIGRPAGAASAAGAPRTLGAARLEQVSVNPLGGSDTISVADLRTTQVVGLALELGSRAGGDGAPDTVAATGSAVPDTLGVGLQGSSFTLGGIGPAVGATNVEPGRDRLTVNGLGGADTLLVSGSGAADNFSAQATGALIRTELGGMTVDSDDFESLRLNTFSGTDTVTLGNLGGGDLGQMTVDLSSPTAVGPGDGEGDAVSVSGSDAADNLGVGGNSSGIAVTGLAVPTSVVSTDPGDRLTVNGLGGADMINASGLAANSALLTLRGGPDADTLTGGPSDETFAWNPGDGNDVVGGGAGTDNLAFNGSDANENIALAPVGGLVQVTRDVDAVSLDLDDVEEANVAPAGGADVVNVPDMPGAEVARVGVNFGGADGQNDTAIATATNNPETIDVSPTATGASVALAPTTSVAGAELGRDSLTINALGGNDTIAASTVPAGLVDFVMQGGLGADIFVASQGSDFIQGGDGNDFALMGAGNDTFVWNPGDDNDILEGQAGTDRMLFNGANVAEDIDISPNGGRLRFFRNVANVTMDCDDLEVVDFNAFGGADNIVVNNMAGTDLSQVNLALAANAGGGDGQPDNVTLNGTAGNDVVSIFGGPAGVNATGLMPGLAITGAEAANDRLTVNGLAGEDTINASGVTTGAILLTLNGDQGNDTLTGGDGNDTLTGGDGNDTMNGGPGDDFFNGGPGADNMNGGPGNDVFLAVEPSDTVTP